MTPPARSPASTAAQYDRASWILPYSTSSAANASLYGSSEYVCRCTVSAAAAAAAAAAAPDAPAVATTTA